jgi:hypothetical protein
VLRAALDLRAEDFEPTGEDSIETPLRRRMGLWARAVLGRLRKHGFGAASRAKDRPGAPSIAFVTKGAFGSEGRGGLVLRIDGDGVNVGVEVPPRSARRARTQLADPSRALELGALLEALPEQFAMAVVGDKTHLGVAGAKSDEVRALLARADREERSLWIGWHVPREVAVAHSALLDEQLEDAIVALAGIFPLVAGEEEEVPGFGARRRAHRRRRTASGQADDDRDGPEARARGRSRSIPEGAADPTERDLDVGERDPAISPPRPPRSLDTGALLRTSRRRMPSPRADRGHPVERGSKVRVVDGPFAGKVGVVHELDGRGGARVMLGLLAVRVDLNKLAPCGGGRQRLRLSTSHRKPVPARS